MQSLHKLNVVDVFSKYVWRNKLFDEKGSTVLDAFRQVVKSSGRKSDHFRVDLGKKLNNNNMDEWIKENGIVRYSTYGEHKSAVVERFNKTVKNMLRKRFTAENTRNWIDILDKLLSEHCSFDN